MFKSLSLYSLNEIKTNQGKVDLGLSENVFAPCGALDTQTSGWSPVRDDQLLHSSDKQILLDFTVEKKSIPSAALKARVDARCAKLTHRPTKQDRKDIKEAIIDELLPNILPVRKSVGVWIDQKNSRVAIESTSKGMLDLVIPALFKAGVEVTEIDVKPQVYMTEQVRDPTDVFGIEDFAELVLPGEKGTIVRYTNADLACDEIQDQLDAGMQVCKLAMTQGDRVSFVLNSQLQFSKIEPLIKPEKTPEVDKFDADFLLMTSDLTALFDVLLNEMKGEDE
jgi:recombination associated protein RdgC